MIMGTISEGIAGDFSGKVGPVIGSSWKGVGYMRSRPAKVANPKTQGQLDHRAKFAAVVQFLKPLTIFLRTGFDSQAIRMSAYNAAVKYNYHHALSGIFPDFAIDYSKVMVSSGTLPGALNPVITTTHSGQIEFTWENNSNGITINSKDNVLLAVYNPKRQEAVTIIGGNIRQSERQSIQLPSTFQGEEVYCYIAFQNTIESKVSNSQFIGGIVVL